jgi:predicted MFS family arabinose efflux permease
VLSIIGLVSLVYGIIEGPESGWRATQTVVAFVIAAVSLTTFVLWELRATWPMLDPRYFADRRFSLGAMTITVAFFGIFGMFFVLTQFLQFVQGHSALEAGLRILPYGVVLLIVSPRAADLTERHGARIVTTSGMAIAAIGFGALALLEPSSQYALIAVGLVLAALGTGLLMPPATTALVAALPPAKAGVGSAMNDTTREVGGALGIAVVGALMSVGYRGALGNATDRLDPSAAEDATDSFGGLLSVTADLEPAVAQELVQAGQSAFTNGMQLGMFTAAALLGVGAVLVASLHPSTEQN